MKRVLVLSCCLLAITLLLAAMPASADTVHMYFNGAEGGSLGGINVYPYGFKINGTGDYPLMCDTFTRGISPGDNWDAYVQNMATLNNLNVANLFYGNVNGGGSGAVQYYMAAALLFEDARTNNSNTAYDNWATWLLFDPTDTQASSNWQSLSSGDQTTIENYLAAAIAAAAGDTPSDFSDVQIYTPVDGVGQEFFGWDTPGTTPEPSSLALFGTGVLGIAGVLRRKLRA